MKKIWLLGCFLATIAFDSAISAPLNSLTLDQALALAYTHSPLIKGSEAEVRAAQGERDQADALPNPVLSLDAENIGGTGAYSGTDNAELTVGLSQLIEIGGKRSARKQAADHGKSIAHYGQDAAKMDLKRDVTQAFATAVAAQEQAVIAADQLKLAKDVYATVNKRVNAAAEPLVQRNKAKISLTNAELAAEQAQGRKKAAVKMLAALWGDAQSMQALSSDWFYKIEKPASYSDVKTLLQHSVNYKRQIASMDQAKYLLDLEKANAVPDPSFNLGLRELRATNDQVIVAGLSIPLAVFNRNNGTIEKARQQAVKADTDRQRLLLDGQARLADLAQQLENAWLTSNKIKKDILPQAQEAFTQAKRGYMLGKFPYLEVLDAQRTLADTRQAYVQALLNYHTTKADIERLTAQEDHTGDTK